MLTDSTGYAPELWNSIKDWWDAKRGGTRDGHEDSSLIRNIGSTILGTGIASSFIKGFSRAGEWIGGNPVLGFSKFLKGAGIFITGVVLTFELADTWDAINDNTNGERVWKSLIQISGTLAMYYTVSASIAVASAAFAGTILCVGVLAPLIIGAVIVTGIYVASEYTYNQLGIE